MDAVSLVLHVHDLPLRGGGCQSFSDTLRDPLLNVFWGSEFSSNVMLPEPRKPKFVAFYQNLALVHSFIYPRSLATVCSLDLERSKGASEYFCEFRAPNSAIINRSETRCFGWALRTNFTA